MTTVSLNYLSDNPAQIDALGRQHFAKSLAKSLVTVTDGHGIVIGIEGSWGSGKSTIIGFVKDELNNLNSVEPPIVVDFNPWMVSNTGALVDTLITQIAAAINTNPVSPKKALIAAEKLLGYIALLKNLKYLKYVPGVAAAGAVIDDIVSSADSIVSKSKEAQDVLDEVRELLPNIDLTKKKAEVVAALRELNCPIIVVVDDVDRLAAEEIRTVVQTIKAVADFPRTTYLLAYEREVVATALGNGDASSGLAYLEKIIQLSYPIPPLFQYQLRSFANKKLQELFSLLNIELREYESQAYQKALGHLVRLLRHPRDVIRLVNRLILSLPATVGEVNSIDVIVFEALSQRFPRLRESVHLNPYDFIGMEFDGDLGRYEDGFDIQSWNRRDAERKAGTPAWTKHLPESEIDADAAGKACNFLFSTKGKSSNYQPQSELRLADQYRLARYFRLTSLESVPEASEIHSMFCDTSLLGGALATDSEQELISLLEWLDHYLPSCPSPRAASAIEVVIQRCIGCDNQCQSSSLQTAFIKILRSLLATISANERVPSFKMIISNAPLHIAESLLLDAAAQHDKWFIRSMRPSDDSLMLIPDSSVVDQSLMTWTGRVRNKFTDGTLFSEIHLHSILHRFGQLNYAYDEVYSMIRSMTALDGGLEAFLQPYHDNPSFNSIESFTLVEDAELLIELINKNQLDGRYAWLTLMLSETTWKESITKQADKFKSKKN
jgi:hypothetical protein